MNMSITSRYYQRGLTLIELMISLALGLALTAGAISVFQQNKETFNLQESVSRLQETGRYAMNIMARDIRSSGYRGCKSRLAASNNSFLTAALQYEVDQTWTAASITTNFNQGISGYEYDSGASDWAPTLDSVISGESPRSGTDVIVLRPIKGCNRNVTNMTSCTNGNGNINVNSSVAGCFQEFDVGIVSNCESASIFVVTNNPTTSLEHGIGSSNTSSSRTTRHASGLGNTQPNLSECFGGNPDPDGSSLSRIVNVVYFIANSGANNAIPALFRMENGGTPVELLEGVEDMQILYGEDTVDDDIFVVTSFVPADSVTDWSNVLAVRINLVMQTLRDNVTPTAQTIYYDRNGDDAINTNSGSADEFIATDNRVRKVFSTTVALRNRMS